MFLKAVSIFILSLAALLAPWAAQAEDARSIRIGILDTVDPWFYVQTFGPTMDHLRKSFPEYRFQTEELSFERLREAASQSKLDFFIAPSGFFAFASESSGARLVASRRRALAPDPGHSVGSAFVVRASDSRFRSLPDLRGMTAAVTAPNSFDGWIIAAGELSRITKDPDRFFKSVLYTGYGIPDVATLVINREADVGVMRACELELLESEGAIPAGALRVIGEKPSRGLACRCSTDLYPDVVFAALPPAPAETVRQMTVALYTMPETLEGDSWSFVSNFASVLQLYRTLRIGPYSYLRENTPAAFLQRYRYVWLSAAGLLVFSLLYALSVRRIVQVRTRALRVALQEKEAAEASARESRERLNRIEKAGVVSELSAMFAHDAKQPIASLINYADGLKMLLSGRAEDELVTEAVTAISEQAERLSGIIDRVRAYAKREERVRTMQDLRAVARQAVETFRKNYTLAQSVTVREELPGEEAPCRIDPLEIELLLVNLLRNSAAAVQGESEKTAVLRLEGTETAWVMTLTDSGPVMTAEALARLAVPGGSEKSDGLGLGLAICRMIAESHGGNLLFRAASPKGLAVQVTLPRPQELTRNA